MSVDFNTADPLIRWDSYENLSADGEGGSGDLTSVTRLGRSCPHSAGGWEPAASVGGSTHAFVSLGVLLRVRLLTAVMGSGQSVRLSPRSFPAQRHQDGLPFLRPFPLHTGQQGWDQGRPVGSSWSLC